MKRTNSLEVFTATNSDTDVREIKMGIDPVNFAAMIDMATNLYSDPMLAVIREYSNNAEDSHTEAGQTRPIEITYPTMQDSTFIVEDFGMGLDEEEIATIYSKYGASTKNESNEFVGMMGVGGKAALAYTSTFTIEGTKDGVTVVAVVTKGPDRIGVIRILDTLNLGQPNGVRISVPIRNQDVFEFCRKADNFYGYWNNKAVKLLNREKQRATRDWTEITPDIHIDRSYGPSHIVMGNVAYPHTIPSGDGLNGVRFIARVPIGAVDIAPSREALNYSDKSVAKCKEVIDTIKSTMASAFAKKLAAAKNFKEECEAIDEYSRFRYGWLNLPNLNSLATFESNEFWRVASGGRRRDNLAINVFTRNDNPIYIRNFPLKGVSESHLDRLANLGYQPYRETLCFLPPSDRDLSCLRGVDWADVPKIVQQRIKGMPAAPKAVPTYKCYHLGRFVEMPLDESKTLVYYSNHNDARPVNPRKMQEAYPDVTLIDVPLNRVDKLKRLYSVTKADEWYLKELKATMDSLSPDAQRRIDAHTSDQIVSDTIREAGLMAKIKNRKFLDLVIPPADCVDDETNNKLVFFGIANFKTVDDPKSKIVKSFPLIRSGFITVELVEDLILYINAKI